MKRFLLGLLLAFIIPMSVVAQSSMTDEQVMKFVLKEQQEGTSQQQIVTKLMQRGVDITQLRRVKRKAERLQKEQGLGTTDKSIDDNDTQDRTRKGKSSASTGRDGKKKRTTTSDEKYKKYSSKRMKDGTKTKHTYDEDDEEWMLMQDELGDFMPDSLQMLRDEIRQEIEEQMKKKIFGHDIFNNEALSFEPNMNIATPQNYRLGPGDAVYIDIYGASQKSVQSTVSPDGYLNIEDFGPVQVSGLTVSEANARLRQTLGARYQSSRIRLSVGETRSIVVNVMGEVEMPGTYTLSAFASVFHALYMAGGVNDIGTMRNVKVFRNNRLVTTVDIYDYILNGKLTGNVMLHDNDVIVVGPYDCLVDIRGKVKRPMFYEMKKEESVQTLLRYAGGFTGDAYRKSVRVLRRTGREYSVYNVSEFDMSSFHVADGDSVSVDSIMDRYENTVELKGAVFRPGKYQLGGDITTVRSLLESAEGVKEEAFTDHAVMHRMKEDRTLEVVSVDVDGILSGEVADIPLKENDVLFIPTKQNMMEDQTLTIHGEVQYPGIYKYASNETIEDFILQAGGLKESASVMKVDVSRRIINPKATVPDSVIAKTYTFTLKEGFIIDNDTAVFHLMPFDEVYVRKSPGYTKQQNVTVEGEVLFAGTYALSKQESRLSDIIKAAGGPSERAYVKGARLERRINEQERLRMEEVQKISQEQLEDARAEELARLGNAASTVMAQSGLANNSQRQKKYQVSTTTWVGIELDKALANPGGQEDIVLREGDRIIVPTYNATVKINGEVMSPNTVGYIEGKNASYYIDQAGGYSSKAKKRQTYIVYMNGTKAKVRRGVKPAPGCEIVVPAKPTAKTSISEQLAIGTSIASIATIIATLANILK